MLAEHLRAYIETPIGQVDPLMSLNLILGQNHRDPGSLVSKTREVLDIAFSVVKGINAKTSNAELVNLLINEEKLLSSCQIHDIVDVRSLKYGTSWGVERYTRDTISILSTLGVFNIEVAEEDGKWLPFDGVWDKFIQEIYDKSLRLINIRETRYKGMEAIEYENETNLEGIKAFLGLTPKGILKLELNDLLFVKLTFSPEVYLKHIGSKEIS